MATATKQRQRPQLLQAAISALGQPDIREKLLFTFALLVIFRFVSNVPVPGANPAALQTALSQSRPGTGVVDLLNVVSGGALSNMSVAAMGVYPYITASIVMQLMTPIVPTLQALAKEGEQGRKQINIYTHWMTVPMAFVQGYGQLILLQSIAPGAFPNVTLAGPNGLDTLSAIITMTAGTMFLVWIGELISERGIGNGISVLIFAGIIAGIPQYAAGRLLTGTGEGVTTTFFLLIMTVALVAFIVYFQEAQRRIPVQYSRSVFRSGRMYRQSGQTHIPLRVNTVGMIPLIFAFSIVIFPAYLGSVLETDSSFLGDAGGWMKSAFTPENPWYWVFVFVTVVVFTFFYTIVVFQQQNLSENLQRQGGFIPGIRPGRPTQEYINRVLLRITWGGAFFLGLVAVAPFIFSHLVGAGVSGGRGRTLSIGITASGLIIVVGVVLDTLRQIEAQLLMRQYEGFIR